MTLYIRKINFIKGIINKLWIFSIVIPMVELFGQTLPQNLEKDFVIISKQQNKDIFQRNEAIILFGTMKIDGTILIEPKYHAIKSLGMGYLAIKETNNSRYSIYTSTGKKLTDAIYDDIMAFSTEENVSRFSRMGNWGFIDLSLNEIVPPVYSYVLPFREGLAAVVIGKKYGYINREGKMVINPLLDFIDQAEIDYKFNNDEIFRPTRLSSMVNFSNGFAVIKKNNKYGYINREGKIAIPPQYDYVRPFSSHIAIVGNKVSYLPEMGRERYSTEDYFGHFLIDTLGNRQTKDDFLFLGLIGEGLISAVKLETQTYEQNLKRIKHSSLYRDSELKSANKLFIKESKLFGFIDLKGEWIIPPTFPYTHLFDLIISYFNNDYAFVSRNQGFNYTDVISLEEEKIKYNFIDKSGKYLSDDNFSLPNNQYYGFRKNGLAIVGISDNDQTIFYTSTLGKTDEVHEINAQYFGYINKSGVFVIPPLYKEVTPFVKGLSQVKGNKDCQNIGSCYIDVNGRYVYYDENALLPKEFRIKE
ncbi:WG repeat-containing protein [Leadbetterella byssophila]|uniref:WG repeat-containing protein n=1 Tax=Leadbetterella byssophila TaxID=316068 RepID=UPI0039A013F7